MTTNALDQAALNNEVAKYVSRGYAVESSSPGQVILFKKGRIGVFWNVVLSILTGGIWLFVVLFKVLNRKTSRVVLTVGEDGRVIRG